MHENFPSFTKAVFKMWTRICVYFQKYVNLNNSILFPRNSSHSEMEVGGTYLQE